MDSANASKSLMQEKPMNVVVVGGSLSGLMYGLMIKRIGHNVHLLEQTETSSRASQAAGLATGPSGMEYMKIHDLITEPYSIRSPEFKYLDNLGSIKRTAKFSLNLTSWDVLYFRLRANFDGLASDYCPQPPEPLRSDGEAIYDLGKRAVSTMYSDKLVSVKVEDLISEETFSLDADLVIIADGSHSIIRGQLLPRLISSYSGYVAWRGTVPEREVTQSTKDIFDKDFNVFAMNKSYIVGYAMPGESGTLLKGQRVFNYVWYYNCPHDSSEYVENMTDTDGHVHANTLPIGKIRPETWERLKTTARKVLNLPFLELVEKTKRPFISTVRDCASPQAAFYNGQLLLVGEALTLFRPHTGSSLNQSALDCLELRKVLLGEKTIQAWEASAMQSQKTTSILATAFGEYYQSGILSYNFITAALLFVGAIVHSRLSRLWSLVRG